MAGRITLLAAARSASRLVTALMIARFGICHAPRRPQSKLDSAVFYLNVHFVSITNPPGPGRSSGRKRRPLRVTAIRTEPSTLPGSEISTVFRCLTIEQ
jgi:hypothetical protein